MKNNQTALNSDELVNKVSEVEDFLFRNNKRQARRILEEILDQEIDDRSRYRLYATSAMIYHMEGKLKKSTKEFNKTEQLLITEARNRFLPPKDYYQECLQKDFSDYYQKRLIEKCREIRQEILNGSLSDKSSQSDDSEPFPPSYHPNTDLYRRILEFHLRLRPTDLELRYELGVAKALKAELNWTGQPKNEGFLREAINEFSELYKIGYPIKKMKYAHVTHRLFKHYQSQIEQKEEKPRMYLVK